MFVSDNGWIPFGACLLSGTATERCQFLHTLYSPAPPPTPWSPPCPHHPPTHHTLPTITAQRCRGGQGVAVRCWAALLPEGRQQRGLNSTAPGCAGGAVGRGAAAGECRGQGGRGRQGECVCVGGGVCEWSVVVVRVRVSWVLGDKTQGPRRLGERSQVYGLWLHPSLHLDSPAALMADSATAVLLLHAVFPTSIHTQTHLYTNTVWPHPPGLR